MGVESPNRMGRVYLKDGRILDITEEQSIYLAKLFFFIPDHKSIKLADEVFTFADLDYDAYRRAKLPQQTGMELGVPIVDNREVQTNQ